MSHSLSSLAHSLFSNDLLRNLILEFSTTVELFSLLRLNRQFYDIIWHCKVDWLCVLRNEFSASRHDVRNLDLSYENVSSMYPYFSGQECCTEVEWDEIKSKLPPNAGSVVEHFTDDKTPWAVVRNTARLLLSHHETPVADRCIKLRTVCGLPFIFSLTENDITSHKHSIQTVLVVNYHMGDGYAPGDLHERCHVFLSQPSNEHFVVSLVRTFDAFSLSGQFTRYDLGSMTETWKHPVVDDSRADSLAGPVFAFIHPEEFRAGQEEY